MVDPDKVAMKIGELAQDKYELREVLADLVFQCEDVPTIQTDRAKAVLDEIK